MHWTCMALEGMLSSVEAWFFLAKTATVLGIIGTILTSVTMAVVMTKCRFSQGLGGTREELRNFW